jgi:hypothetical protein
MGPPFRTSQLAARFGGDGCRDSRRRFCVTHRSRRWRPAGAGRGPHRPGGGGRARGRRHPAGRGGSVPRRGGLHLPAGAPVPVPGGDGRGPADRRPRAGARRASRGGSAEPRPAQRQAAGEAQPAGAALLEAGAGAADAVVEGELLRAAHSCRVASLLRLTSAAARVAERVRHPPAEADEFRLDAPAVNKPAARSPPIATTGRGQAAYATYGAAVAGAQAGRPRRTVRRARPR